MTLVSEGLNSPLISEQNSQGIILEATPQSVDLPEIELESMAAPSPAYMSREGLSPLQEEAESVVEQFDFADKTTLSDSLVASAKSWDFLRFYDTAKLESKIVDNEAGLYTPDPDYNLQTSLDHVDIPLGEDEVKWLKNKDITSENAFDLYINDIKEKRELAKVASVNPKTSLLTSFLDPTYIATGGLIGAGAKALRLGKFSTASIVGASEYGITKAQEYHRPVSTLELVASTVLPTAVTLAVYKQPFARQSLNGSSEVSDRIAVGKGKVANVEFDSMSNSGGVRAGVVETVDTVSNIDAINTSRSMPLGKNPEMIKPKSKIDVDGLEIPPKLNREGLPHSSEIDWKQTNSKGVPFKYTAYKKLYAFVEDTRIPQSLRDMTKRLLLQGGKDLAEVDAKTISKMKQAGRYYPKDNKVVIRKGTGASTLNHEVAHALTSVKVAFGKANPNSVHGELVKEIEDLRNYVKSIYDARRKANPKEFSIRQKQEITYSLKDPDEFLASLYEGDTAFKKLLESTEVPNNLKHGSEKNLLQSLYTGLRRLLGFTVEEANAFNKALKLSDDLIDSPTIKYTDLKGKVHEFKASEVTPELIHAKSAEEATEVFEANLTQKVGKAISWNLFDTLNNVKAGWANKIISNPTQGAMQSNVVATKRYIASHLGVNRIDAEQAIEREISRRGVGIVDRLMSTQKYKETLWQIETEVAEYVERRSQAKLRGQTLPNEDTPIAKIAEMYNKMTKDAKEIGIQAGIFKTEVGGVDWYLPRKVNSDKFMGVFRRFEELYGDKASTKFVDAMASIMNLGGDAKYTRHVAYIYYRRMQDKYNHVTDPFRSHLGNEVIDDTMRYLEEIGVTDQFTKDHITNMLTGALDKRGEASFQRARLDIDTMREVTLDDGSTFRFFDMQETGVLDLYSRYSDNIAGRVGLAEHDLGTPTLWNKYKEELINDPKLMNNPSRRREISELVDNIYDDILGYPVGERLNPFLQATRAYTQSVALKFSGVWQAMEIVPTLIRHAQTNGLSDTFKITGKSYFQSLKNLEKTKADDLVTFLARTAMDDLKVSPLSARQADNFDLNMNTISAKVNHLSQYTYVANGMRYLMGKQAITSANLIVDSIQKATKGEAKSVTLLKKFGMTDDNIKTMKEMIDLHGLDYRKWDIDARNDTLPKLINLLDTDVLRSRLGEVPAFMQFSSVGKVLGTFRNFIFSSHNKIFTSNLRDGGVMAVALITAYQLPMAMLSVQVANLAKGEPLEDDPIKLLNKAFVQTGGLGLVPEVVGLLTGETKNFGSPFTLGLDRVAGLANAVGSGDPIKVAEKAGDVVPVLSVTLGFQAGLQAVLDTLREDEIDK